VKTARTPWLSCSLISAGCIVSGGQVARSLLFTDVRVNSYCEVTDSILLPRVNVGRRCRLSKTIEHIPRDSQPTSRRNHVDGNAWTGRRFRTVGSGQSAGGHDACRISSFGNEAMAQRFGRSRQEHAHRLRIQQ